MSFALFVVRRLLGIAALAWLSTLAAFGLFHAGVPDRAADAQIDAQLGPGRPIASQYFHYLVRLLHGDLGQSLIQGLSVDALLRRALPPTLSLMIGGLVLWLAVGVLAAAIVDQTFALNGIGQALLTAVKTGDLMTIMGTVLITVILIGLASLLADIAQKILDPQVA